jgi:uncharacterized protein
MRRDQALELIKIHVHNPNLIKHMLAVEAVMKELASHFNSDEELWGLTGLIHDLDVELTAADPEQHALVSVKLLEPYHLVPEIIYAIQAHNDKCACKSLLDKALYCADPLTGFIVACALVANPKKISILDLDFLNRRFKEKRFAAGASRVQMAKCEQLNLNLDEFFALGLRAMKKIEAELGL